MEMNHMLVGEALSKARKDYMTALEARDWSEEGQHRRRLAYVVVDALTERYQRLYKEWYKEWITT